MAITTIGSGTLISKAIFGVGIVAIAGTVGAVHFAQAATNNSTSGYGTTSTQAVAAADTFETSVASNTATFNNQIKSLEATAETQLAPTGSADVASFDTAFNAATLAYANTTSTAFNTFRTDVMNYANTDVSKDQFIDDFNNAKAVYLNSLDAAKNQLAASLSNLGNQSNVVKDQFMDGFNSERDAYSNNLEQSKNDFAATIG